MEGYAPPETWTCNDCLLAGQWRCRDCFGGVVLCRGCCRRRHEQLPFHQQEIWTGSFFAAAFLWEAGLRLYLGHNGDPCPEFHHNHEVWQREQETLDLGDQQVDRSGAENGMDVDDAAGESINRPRMAEDVAESGPSNAGATDPGADADNDAESAADDPAEYFTFVRDVHLENLLDEQEWVDVDEDPHPADPSFKKPPTEDLLGVKICHNCR